MIPETFKYLWEPKVWHYIQGLSKAIEKVDSLYIRNNTEDNKRYHVEHVFAYEFYSVWKSVLKEMGENPDNLMLNGELTKHYYSLENDEYKFPDMVLHGGYRDIDNQCVICEIKSSRNAIPEDALYKDMKSLQAGIKILGFKCAVFIYLGDDLLLMIDKLHDILMRLGAEKKILFIGLNGSETKYEIL